MDRGTKLMFGMLTAAVCLMVIMMISREAPQAHADMYRSDTGGEPTIVWYGSASVPDGSYLINTLYRAWSDGTIEARKWRMASCGSWVDCAPNNLQGWKTQV